MQTVITTEEQVTADWLDRVLRRHGSLPRGRATRVERSAHPTTTSTVIWLSVCYSDDVPASAPRRLLLKISRPEFHPEFGEAEVEFYHRVAPAMQNPPVAHCYDAAYSPETRRSHLLLEDLSASHVEVDSRPAPPRETCDHIMDCLARFHAFWWAHPRLGSDIGSAPTPPHVARVEDHLAGFLSFLGDQLPLDKQRIYSMVVSTMLDRWERRFARRHASSRTHLTLIHGDAHFENFLVPRQKKQNDIRIIDWQFWNMSVGPQDLAFMIARNWTREERGLLELDLVRRYHDGLVRRGVEGYAWADCWEDYRECVVGNLLIPMWQWQGQLTPETDWDGLNKVFDAFEDLQCEELLPR
jgi:thiamine kinase-like enzyme